MQQANVSRSKVREQLFFHQQQLQIITKMYLVLSIIEHETIFELGGVYCDYKFAP